MTSSTDVAPMSAPVIVRSSEPTLAVPKGGCEPARAPGRAARRQHQRAQLAFGPAERRVRGDPSEHGHPAGGRRRRRQAGARGIQRSLYRKPELGGITPTIASGRCRA